MRRAPAGPTVESLVTYTELSHDSPGFAYWPLVINGSGPHAGLPTAITWLPVFQSSSSEIDGQRAVRAVVRQHDRISRISRTVPGERENAVSDLPGIGTLYIRRRIDVEGADCLVLHRDLVIRDARRAVEMEVRPVVERR